MSVRRDERWHLIPDTIERQRYMCADAFSARVPTASESLLNGNSDIPVPLNKGEPIQAPSVYAPKFTKGQNS